VKSSLGILQFVFGCRHRQKSGVFTIKKRTYQVCLKCGQEFEYSWARMRSVRSNVARVPHPPLKTARLDEEAVG
jgi:hypothetical protein